MIITTMNQVPICYLDPRSGSPSLLHATVPTACHPTTAWDHLASPGTTQAAVLGEQAGRHSEFFLAVLNQRVLR